MSDQTLSLAQMLTGIAAIAIPAIALGQLASASLDRSICKRFGHTWHASPPPGKPTRCTNCHKRLMPWPTWARQRWLTNRAPRKSGRAG